MVLVLLLLEVECAPERVSVGLSLCCNSSCITESSREAAACSLGTGGPLGRGKGRGAALLAESGGFVLI